MKILIYLGHPAQYHFFKNIVKNLQKNNKIRYLIKTKEVLESLLIGDKVEYKNILPEGRKSTKTGVVWGLIKREVKVLNEALKFKPDIMLGGDPSVAHIGKLLRIPVLIVSEDDATVISELSRITYPFASHIIAPDACDCGRWNNKKISYAGYMKLAYLHPNYFLHKPVVTKSIILIRTSMLEAYHDNGIGGLSESILSKIIKYVNNKHTIFISSENKLSSAFNKYTLEINPSKLHNLLAKTAMLISDSQSMSMEAAMLGVPSIRYSDFAGRIGVLEELEKKYGLTFGIRTGQTDQLFAKIQELLNTPKLADKFQKRREKMLSEKIDVTAFMVWFIENYPQSIEIAKKDKNYQYNFQ